MSQALIATMSIGLKFKKALGKRMTRAVYLQSKPGTEPEQAPVESPLGSFAGSSISLYMNMSLMAFV